MIVALITLLFIAPLVFPLKLRLLLRSKVALDLEHVPDLLRALPSHHVRNRFCSNLMKTSDVQVVGSRGSVRGQQDEEGIEIITIDDSPEHNERAMENSDSSLRKRNLEISVRGTDDSSDEAYSRGLPEKRICRN